MAASNNTLPSFSPSSITTLISIKLTASNYLLWHSQFVPLLRSQKLMGYIDGTIPLFARPHVPPYDELVPNLHGQDIRMNSHHNFDTAFFAKKNKFNFAGDPSSCQVFGKRGHTTIKCWRRFDNSYQDAKTPKKFSALTIAYVNDPEWYPDSEAASHMTNSEGSKNGKDTWERK
ncbi:uncharacterized protein LOC141702102 [Apium graveolens]|uniref:uncharacterized protein LOC141702102 n=1 Tax=Apium graveolens TaxID=4045 RepID=UPI003D7A3E0D